VSLFLDAVDDLQEDGQVRIIAVPQRLGSVGAKEDSDP
jgi:hypothetical protein